MVLKIAIYKRLILVITMITALALSSLAQNVEKMIVKEVHSIWEDAELIHLPLDETNDTLPEGMKDGDIIYKVSDGTNDEARGYVLLTSALGRYDAFDYFLIFSESLEVRLVKVAIYRSSHGSAVCSKRWLKQFVGYKGGKLIYGKDIQAISGATLSGTSIVADIQRAQQLLSDVIEGKQVQVF